MAKSDESMKQAKIKRCSWVNLNNPQYIEYHDVEWGKPVNSDNLHFELLTLEGAQAGLSWEIVLKKRNDYYKLFSGFDPKKVARFNASKIEKLLSDPRIVRNRLKIESTISNAKAFIKIQNEYGSFNDYIWQFVDYKPIESHFIHHSSYPQKTELSIRISKDLIKRGFRFVGPTIIYAYLQAAGLVNDHIRGCSFK